MAQINIKQIITSTIASLLLLQMTQAQRPSFAGARPPGLNQKDKYNMNNIINNNNSNTDITNRFGTPDQTTTPLPFGATQKPPASFIPIVFPESNYAPLITSKVKPTPDVIANRFGSAENLNTNALGSGATTSMMANKGAGEKADDGSSVRVPIDAKNDHELVAILNRMPVDQRPFWFINAAAIEAQRNGSFRNFAGAADVPRTFFG
ncbi:uncharacterized protein [Eurosta solidaginis]|uniref:uncharacterized protein n=1 Tax=Eurosta solidaginis TaxID=178769 RepID=UPI00353156B2